MVSRVVRRCSLLVLQACPLLVAAALPAHGQTTPEVPSITAGRIPEDGARPAMDGRVDEAIWSTVEPYATFTQQDPVEGAPATERTEVRVLFDRRNIYFGIICFDSNPAEIMVTQSRRDSDLNEGDSIQIVLDTFNDRQNGFVFGTNPIGIEYDGQVANEGGTSGFSGRAGGAGSQRGSISSFNANWDADWSVRSRITERGWEAEMAIPLKTLRYATGTNQTWGFNVMRNIRRKNEQVYMAPIPRGYSLHRVSLAAKLNGLDLPARRDIKVIPFVLASADKDYTASTRQLDRNGDAGFDVKWGIRPNLTADFTVNTDFAQVEADEEQVNLTRFPLFFPEKRGFFLENASIFQFGTPQTVDLFFTRRVGLSSSGVPIDIIGGARLSGRVGGYNVGLLNMQTDRAENSRTGQVLAPANNFTVVRVQREFGRSNAGAIFVGRVGTGSAAADADHNRAYGVDLNLQVTQNGKWFNYIARTDSVGRFGSDYAGRTLYQYAKDPWNIAAGYTQVGEQFNPEVGFLPRRGYRRPEARVFYQPQPKRWPWIRRISPHVSWNAEYGFDGAVQTSRAHIHPFEIQPRDGGRFGWFMEYAQDRPIQNFTVFSGTDGRRLVIAPALYGWVQHNFEYQSNPSAPVFGNVRYTKGDFYNGTIDGFDADIGGRIGAKFRATVGWGRQNVDLPNGSFHTDLVPVKVSYSFTTLSNVQALIQYNSQSATLSSNIRLAILNRSGTGLFVVYNDRRDTSNYTSADILGRSFIVKFNRLFDF